MNGRAFVDTNVLVYAHDRTAGQKHNQARRLLVDLWEQRSGVLSTQVLQEFYVTVRRKVSRPLPHREAARLVAEYTQWEVVVNSGISILQAVELEERYRLSFWDALIANAAIESHASRLLSEDFRNGQSFGNVLVVNPFLDDPIP
jgi:predicted nucleic acid-binding protein